MLKEQKYKVLIVSSSDKFSTSLERLIAHAISAEMVISTSISQARRLLLERNYDIVIINSPVQAENGLLFALSIHDSNQAEVMYFSPANEYNEAYDKAHEFGIYVLAKPTEADLFIQTLRLLCSTSDKVRQLSKTTVSFKEKLEEIKLVNEAKLLIINKMHVHEDVAHKMIEQQAMNFRITKRKSAELYIEKFSKWE